MHTRKLVDLGHFRFSHFARENAANTLPARVHVEHDLGGLLPVECEEHLQDLDHEIHRGEVVIEQHHLVKRWTCDFGLGGFHRQSVVMFSFGIRVLSHDASISRVGGGRTQAWTKPPISTDNRSFSQQAG